MEKSACLSRGKFTRQFKEEAVSQLELGASAADAADGCGVKPEVQYRFWIFWCPEGELNPHDLLGSCGFLSPIFAILQVAALSRK